MAVPETPPNGQAETRRAREVRRLLARMDRMEEFAQSYEQIDHLPPDLPRWELECQRQNFAETYRRLVGVRPKDRAILRTELLAVLARKL